jgi:hypothetical protein
MPRRTRSSAALPPDPPAHDEACPLCSRPPPSAAVWPPGLTLSAVEGPTGQLAWREATLRNLVAGACTDAQARVIASLLSGAGAAKPPERDGAGGETDAVGRLDAALARWSGPAGSKV